MTKQNWTKKMTLPTKELKSSVYTAQSTKRKHLRGPDFTMWLIDNLEGKMLETVFAGMH